MTKDVLVRVRGTQILDDTHDSVEVITGGSYYLKDGKHYILYDESVEGVDEATGNTVKASERTVEVLKRGPVTARMVFEKGKKHLANYVTPVGLIVLGITTTELAVAAEEEEVRVHLEYALEMNGEFVSNCRMDISAAPRREGLRLLK